MQNVYLFQRVQYQRVSEVVEVMAHSYDEAILAAEEYRSTTSQEVETLDEFLEPISSGTLEDVVGVSV